MRRAGLELPPYSFGVECLAGVAQAKPSTAFPLPVALGATFDVDLVEEVASAIGDEARALYNAGELPSMHCLGPVLNLARDPGQQARLATLPPVQISRRRPPGRACRTPRRPRLTLAWSVGW